MIDTLIALVTGISAAFAAAGPPADVPRPSRPVWTAALDTWNSASS